VLASDAFVALMDTDGAQGVPTLNRTSQPRSEEYVQTVIISVAGSTRDDQVTLADRCFAIFAEICDQLRSTVHLEGFYAGGGQIASCVIDNFSYKPRADDTAREANIEFGIRVTARLQ
jgi:hypothetical protein